MLLIVSNVSFRCLYSREIWKKIVSRAMGVGTSPIWLTICIHKVQEILHSVNLGGV